MDTYILINPNMAIQSKKEARKGKEKSLAKATAGLSKPTKVPPSSLDEEDDSDWESEDEDEENGGVSEKGMKRLMELVGEEDLDEVEKAQLVAENNGEEDDEDDEEVRSDEDGEVDGDEEELGEVDDESDDDEEDQDEEMDEVSLSCLSRICKLTSHTRTHRPLWTTQY